MMHICSMADLLNVGVVEAFMFGPPLLLLCLMGCCAGVPQKKKNRAARSSVGG